MTQHTALLIQIRHRSDPSAAHEEKCLRRRLSALNVRWVIRNGLEDKPSSDWLNEIDLVFIGGSGYHSMVRHRDEPWVGPLRHVLDQILERQLPGMGLCFGHQLTGHHLGAQVSDASEHAEIGTASFELTPEALSDPIMSSLQTPFRAQTGHSDHVVSVPNGAVLMASNDTLVTQAFRVKGCPFYTTQFHPELTGAEAQQRYQLVQAGLAKTNDEALPEAVSLFKNDQNDTLDLIGRLARHFLEG